MATPDLRKVEITLPTAATGNCAKRGFDSGARPVAPSVDAPFLQETIFSQFGRVRRSFAAAQRHSDAGAAGGISASEAFLDRSERYFVSLPGRSIRADAER